MIWFKLLHCLILLIILDRTSQIQLSLHGHNNAFVQDENNVHYVLDSIPISMQKDFSRSVQRDDSILDGMNQNILSRIHIEPQVLDFQTRELGIPHQKTVTLFNTDCNKTIHLSAISGNTQHFHSSFFQDKVIPPLGNTTFSVVFLGREEGDVDANIYIQTSDGSIKYQVKGVSVSSPYRLRPLVNIKLPLNASFTPLIYIYNPHAEVLQIMEVYSSSGEFQLELPSGDAEGSRELWEIPPYQTKPVIRLNFNAYTERNYTAYIRFNVNNSADVLVVAVEVEVKNGAGLHWGGSSSIINLGMGGSLQPPIHYPIVLKNSSKKPIKIVNIISMPVSKALKVHFEPTTVLGETTDPVTVGTLIYDWKTGINLQHFKGKLLIKAIGPGGSNQKLSIPWIAQVFHGGLEVNTSVTHYCTPQHSHSRNFTVVNKFQIPLAITNVTMAPNTKPNFKIKNFAPRIIKPEQKVTIFSLELTKNEKEEDLKMESSIFIHSNVSVTEIPLLSYDGKLKKIILGERENDKGTMNFGTVSSGTENEAMFALENQNPVGIELHGWGVNMPGAVLELMGCKSGPVNVTDKEFHNITVCSTSGNQYVRPNHLAIFKIKVKTPIVEEDTVMGDVFVKTSYERFILPVYMKVAKGRISLEKLVFADCFPGSICMQQVKIRSTFSKSMEVTNLVPLNRDERIKYIPLEDATLPIISKGENVVGVVKIDPSITCKQHCYLGLQLDSNSGQWLNAMTLPSHTRDMDLNLLSTHYNRFLNTTKSLYNNITMQLDTTEIRGHKFQLNVKPFWPSLLGNYDRLKNNSLLMFPLTQVGNTSYRSIKLQNPSMNPVLVQLVMDWNYPQGARLFHSLPARFKPSLVEYASAVPKEFKVDENQKEREMFKKQWNIPPAPNTYSTHLNPFETKVVRISFTPLSAISTTALLYIRNNMTILEVVQLVGQGAHAQFRFGNRKPGSSTPLLFELSEKHLKDCERDRVKRNVIPQLTVKRSFTARNTGELPIDIYGFYINGLPCEGYGFKVLNCSSFTLDANSTRKVDIAFTPDFTLSRVERNLLILTSLGPDGTVLDDGVIRLNLLATLPSYILDACSEAFPRPSWEHMVHIAATFLSVVLFVMVLIVSLLEADRILRGTMNASRENPVQPPLDFRILTQNQLSSNGKKNYSHGDNSQKEKSLNDDKQKISKKNDVNSNWSIVNRKQKDVQKDLKIPGWSAEDERKFKLETGFKEVAILNKTELTQNHSQRSENNISNDISEENLKPVENVNINSNNTNGLNSSRNNINRSRVNSNANDSNSKSTCNTLATFIGPSNNKNTGNNTNNINYYQQANHNSTSNASNNTVASKKKNNKRQNQSSEQVEGNISHVTSDALSSNDPRDKKLVDTCKSTAPAINDSKKRRNSEQVSKQDLKTSTNDTQFDSNKTVNPKQEYKTKSRVHGNDVNSHNAHKKCESPTDPKIIGIQLSEEETSSTTTEGSVQEDGRNSTKKFEQVNTKAESSQRKVNSKKTKSPTIATTPSVESKDSYEADCDDDELEKERQDNPNPNHWKVNVNRLPQKPNSRSTELFNRLPKQQKNQPRKEKNNQKRKSNEKIHSKTGHANGSFNVSQKTDTPVILPTAPTSLSPPITLWGENRAKFSDVVARNQDSFPSNSSSVNHVQSDRIHQEEFRNESTKLARFGRERVSPPPPPPPQPMPGPSNTFPSSNSYFIDNFMEVPFERELVPYDDLPETDEPMVELESPEEDTRSLVWEGNSQVINLPSNNINPVSINMAVGPEESRTSPLRDNLTVDPNWRPLQIKAAVGEERNGGWGAFTGGVWAAAPWGAAAQPLAQHSQLHTDMREQENSGFDPFRSLKTIWTPSSTDLWKST